MLARAGRESWAYLAAEAGYYDQSHMTAEFRDIMGAPPARSSPVGSPLPHRAFREPPVVRTALRRLGAVAGAVVGLYLLARALAEPFLIDVTDPATYRDDWGGPSLAGVLLVHCGPGLLATAWAVGAVHRGKRRNRGSTGGHGTPPRDRRDRQKRTLWSSTGSHDGVE